VRGNFSRNFVGGGRIDRAMPKDIYPRPEYPRPDYQRGTIEGKDWLNLNGPWQFRFDGDKRGLELGWQNPEGPDWREQIIVPFCWESLAAWGEGETAGNENYYSTRAFRNPLEVNRANHSYVARYEVGWYRRRLHIPASDVWQNKRIILKIGAADFFTDCWCNGKHLGHNEGGYTPFEFDLTDTLTRNNDGSAEGVIVLRVEDPMDNHEQPVGKQWHWYTSTSGIWQTVYVEPRASVHIDCFRVYPDIDSQSARFEIDCVNAPQGSQIQLYIIPPGGQVEVVKFLVEKDHASYTAKIPDPYLWTPNNPDLYRFEMKLQIEGKAVDHIRSYFGMRKIDSGPAEDPKAPAVLRLNNVPRYLRGALHQSYYPDGVYTAGDVEILKNDILWAKRFGFNFLRIHIKIDDPLLLFYADTLGIMLMCDMPNFGEGGDTPVGRRRFEEMMHGAIKRDFNHPSIVAWCVFNETWGFGGQAEFVKIFPEFKKKILLDAPIPPGAVSATDDSAAAAQADKREKERVDNISAHEWVQRTWEKAKKLDPTRLVEDMSVVHWEHLQFFAHGDTDINSWHFYIDDYYRAKEHIQRVVDSTFRGSTFNYVPGYEYKGQPLINSEYGGVGALDGNRDCSWSFKFLTNELRRHPQISAYIYTELHDVEWEYNGFLTYDRRPKDFGFDPRVVNESDTLPIDFPPISRHTPDSIVKVPVASSHYGTAAKDKVSLRWSLGGMDSWGRIHQDISKGIVPIAFPHRRVAHAHTIELKMPQGTMHCTLNVEAVDAVGKRVASNHIQLFTDGGLLPSREDTERTTVLRLFPWEWSEASWSGGLCRREDARGMHFTWGAGAGFFEYDFPLAGLDIRKAHRLRLIFEVSSRRVDTPQTTNDRHSTVLNVELNGVLVNRQIIVDHPHDARGALSYLSGGKRGRGAYGYLISTAIEGEVLARVSDGLSDDKLKLRCTVPEGELAQGGLTLYDTEAGRYPIALLCVLEW
jgi:hypothetical protein